MSFKIAFIGAGSVEFTRRLLADILTVPEFNNVQIAFADINETNLDMVTRLCERDIQSNGLNIQIQSTTDRREALKDARYILNVVRIGGLEAFETDIHIPLKYGVDQCVGDTLCAGGIMYGQRGIPFMLDLCADIREVSEKDALLLNYANPNAMMTWAANKYGGVRCLGLCHGVQHGHTMMAKALGVPQDDLDIICAGINHQTWYISAKYKGQDLLPKLYDAFMADPDIREQEKCRLDMLKCFGYFSTESNGHLSEYLPWYRKRLEDIPEYISLDRWINGETGGYLRECTEKRNWFETDFPNWMREKPFDFIEANRSNEHGSRILEGLETGRIFRGHFNVMNGTCITNLPAECVVEVPGYIDGNGISIPAVGDLPLGCAAVLSASVWVQRLAVEAAVHADISLLRQAMMMDPLVGAVCNTAEVAQMTDEMLIAGEAWLPQYQVSGEIEKARQRLVESYRIPRYEGFEGAARVHTRSVEELAAQGRAHQ